MLINIREIIAIKRAIYAYIGLRFEVGILPYKYHCTLIVKIILELTKSSSSLFCIFLFSYQLVFYTISFGRTPIVFYIFLLVISR